MKTKFTKDYQITSKDLAEAECLTEIDSLKFNNTFSRYYNMIILSIMLSALLVAIYRISDPVFLVNNE